MGFAVPLDSWIIGSLKEEIFYTLDNKESYVNQS